MVSFGFSVVVIRHVPLPQVMLKCASVESVPSILASPVHVPVISASVIAAGAAAVAVAGAAESAVAFTLGTCEDEWN